MPMEARARVEKHGSREGETNKQQKSKEKKYFGLNWMWRTSLAGEVLRNAEGIQCAIDDLVVAVQACARVDAKYSVPTIHLLLLQQISHAASAAQISVAKGRCAADAAGYGSEWDCH